MKARNYKKNGMSTEEKIDRSYCQICRKEIMTESGILCHDCQTKALELYGISLREKKVSNKDIHKDVHTEHCCSLCGCKYGDTDCPVVTGQKKQSHPCVGHCTDF